MKMNDFSFNSFSFPALFPEVIRNHVSGLLIVSSKSLNEIFKL